MSSRQPRPGEEEYGSVDIGSRAKELLEQGTGPDCGKCVCRAVCTLYKSIEPALINGFTKTEQPFQIGELAKICRFYTSKPKE